MTRHDRSADQNRQQPRHCGIHRALAVCANRNPPITLVTNTPKDCISEDKHGIQARLAPEAPEVAQGSLMNLTVTDEGGRQIRRSTVDSEAVAGPAGHLPHRATPAS